MIRNKKIKILISTVLMTLTITGSVFADMGRTTANLNMRTSASTSASRILTIPRGSTVDVLSKVGKWYKVSYNGKVGYSHGSYLTIIPDNNTGSDSSNSSSNTTIEVTASSLNIRSGAGTNYSRIGSYKRGTKITTTGKIGDWYKVSYNGRVGYIHGDYTKVVSTSTGTTTPSTPPSTSTPSTSVNGSYKVTASSLNVRSGSGTSYAVRTKVEYGDIVTVTGQASNGWYSITLANGTTGWVSNAYVTKNNVTAQAKVYSGIPSNVLSTMTSTNQSKSSSQALVEVPYKDFSGNTKVGQLIVNKSVANEVAGIFVEIYEKGGRIATMDLVDKFGADDNKSMSANNSSAYNYRVIAGTNTLSKHASGLAIDINPIQNPHVKSGVASPSEGSAYINRNQNAMGMIKSGDIIHNAFTSRGWKWGGNWTNPDYQHFEK